MPQKDKDSQENRVVIEVKTTPKIEEALVEQIKSQAALRAKGTPEGVQMAASAAGLIICCNA